MDENHLLLRSESPKMRESGVLAAMLAIEFSDAIVNTLSKAAMSQGMNNFVFVMYSNAFASCIVLLLILIFYRKRTLPPLTYCIVGQLFLLGFLSWSLQVLKYFGIGYGSPTLASALSDLIPAFTFILAILFRMEKLNWKTNSTWAKSIGTFVSITGALIITLYKGMSIINPHQPLKLFHENLVSSQQFDWVLGAVLLAAYSFLLSLFFVIQTWVIRKYHAELVVVLSSSIIVSVLSTPAALISEKETKALRLGFNMQLIAIGFSAVFGLSIRTVIHLWVLGKKGPVYVAMFKPVEIVFAVILNITFLGDSLYLGSMIGAATVVIGFYAVIWGKSREKTEEECVVYNLESCSPVVPLLQNKTMGE